MIAEITSRAVDLLKAGLGKTFRVDEYVSQLVTEDEVRKLSNNVSVQPNILVNAGAPIDVSLSDDASFSNDSVNLEVLICVRNDRSLKEQKEDALRYSLFVRKILSGQTIKTPNTNEGVIRGGAVTEEFNIQGLGVYVVTFTTTIAVDLDAVTLPTE